MFQTQSCRTRSTATQRGRVGTYVKNIPAPAVAPRVGHGYRVLNATRSPTSQTCPIELRGASPVLHQDYAFRIRPDHALRIGAAHRATGLVGEVSNDEAFRIDDREEKQRHKETWDSPSAAVLLQRNEGSVE